MLGQWTEAFSSRDKSCYVVKSRLAMKKNKSDCLGEKILLALKQRDDVSGIVLAGSRAMGPSDEFSDFDIHILLSENATLKKEIDGVFGAIAPVLFRFEPHFLSDFVVFYLGDGCKFDVCFYSDHNQLARITDKRVKVVKETINGNLGRVLGSRQPEVAPGGLKEKFLGLALADLLAVARESYRKNIFKARFNLDEAREMIANYINYDNGHFRTGFDKFPNFASNLVVGSMEKSLRNNNSIKGIKIAALELLSVIETWDIFRKKTIKIVRKRLLLPGR